MAVTTRKPVAATSRATAKPATVETPTIEEGVVIIDGFIVITLPLIKKPELSSSGRTYTVATSKGFQWHEGVLPGYSAIGVSVNVSGKK